MKAQSNACHSPAGWLYTDQQGTYGTPAVPNYLLDEESDRYLRLSGVYCATRSVVGTCYITYAPKPGTTVGNAASVYGEYVTFSLVQCGLDSYVVYLLLISGAIGTFFLRRKILLSA
ncbi:hypothetical protein [Pedobacter ginsenosidimutans]|uniref:hypothetical protein n=1 Tax=Pedobacter ginsenosidimutans TaxID=687842 RepID=UPI0012FB99FA|nr:hypothetical protein [Pedobacter ginsenosidimutans]